MGSVEGRKSLQQWMFSSKNIIFHMYF